ncbi:copper resistance protein CopC [Haloactinopolyspora sp.]|uniref:copper resistance CopC/CopD family protein n=1 Tax=Haloactinopolyspora sp. TaxID=1966353 RepID=UPI0026361441|nr:copper resistance protein CopC [Haloactinopolyspora sp.]
MTAEPGLVSRRAAVLAALTGLIFVLLAAVGDTPAAAHAQLEATDPADGTVVADSPGEVTLTFSEPVHLVDNGVRVLDPSGADVDVVTRALDEQVIAELPAEIDDGTYVVSWRVISADSHPIAGAFTFSVGAPSQTTVDVAGEEERDAVDLVTYLVHGVGYLGLLGAAGLVVFQMVLLPARLRPSAGARRIRALTLVGAGLAVLAQLVSLPLTSARQTGDGLEAVADPDAWATQLSAGPGQSAWLAAAGLVVGAAVTRWARPGPGSVGLALAAAGLAVGSLAVVGHTRTFGPGWLVVASDVLHVSCAAMWFGGLIGLWVILRDTHVDPVPAAVLVSRFSATAAFLVAGLAVAGVLLGWRIVGSWAALFGSAYGITLLVKVTLAGAVLVVAAYNRYRLLPRMARAPAASGLRRTVGIEASVIMVILALTGFLVEQNPREDDDTAATPAVVAADGELGAGRVELTLAPGARGSNTLEFHLTDAAGAALTPHHPPTVRLTQPDTDLGPFEYEATSTAPGSYETTVNVPLSGEWIVEVVVRVSEFDEPIARVPVEVN